MIKIYHDTTIEDVTNIATRIESLALKCSPLIQALMKSLTDSLKKSDSKTALKLVKLIKEGGRKGGMKDDPIADRFYNAVSNRKKELGEKAPKTKSLFEYAAKAERIPQSILDKAENYANDVFDKVLKRIEIILQERSDYYNNKPSKLSNRRYQIWIETWIKENGSVKELRKTIIDRIEEHARNMKNPVFIDFIGNKNIDENTRSKWQTSINNKIASIASEFKKKVEALFNKYSDIP